jgi:lipopolysaccharide exporter
MATISPSHVVDRPFARIWNLRRKFSFATNVAVLSGGASLGHCFTVAAAPILTRLYLPPEIGHLGLFSAFLTVITATASLQYEVAIVSASSEKEAAHLAALSMLLTLPMSIAGGFLLYIMINYSLIGFGTLPTYAAGLLGAAMLCVGLFEILRYWALRHEKFGIVSRAVIFQNGGRSFVQVVLGILGSHSFGLLSAEVLGRGIGMSSMMRSCLKVVRNYALTFSQALSVFAKYRRFPLYSMPSSLLNQLGATLPLPLLINLYGLDFGGYYSLVGRLLAVPVVLVSASIADAFHSRAALYAREDMPRVLWLFHSTTAALLAIGIIPAMALSIYGERIFMFAFGSKWQLSGTIASLVAPWFLSSFIVSPLSRLVYVLHGQRLKLIYDFLTLGGNLALFFLARRFSWPMLHMLTAMTGLNTASKVFYYLVLLRIATTATQKALPHVPVA